MSWYHCEHTIVWLWYIAFVCKKNIVTTLIYSCSLYFYQIKVVKHRFVLSRFQQPLSTKPLLLAALGINILSRCRASYAKQHNIPKCNVILKIQQMTGIYRLYMCWLSLQLNRRPWIMDKCYLKHGFISRMKPEEGY